MAQVKEIPTAWTTGWTDIFNTGTWRSAFPYHYSRPSPCHNACPISGEIATWVQQVKNKKYYDAWLTLVDNNPLPAVTGSICHHPCEQSCNRKEYDGALAINTMERFVGLLALEENWSLPKSDKITNRKVAVVGGGPAGLSAAYQLRRMGYKVTIFESRPQLGGLLRYGIPAYRLPKDILDQEIDRLLQTGIEVQTGTAVTKEELKQLKDKYDAVFIATGAQNSKKLPQFNNEPWLFDGLEFLEKVSKGEAPELGERVVVIGGGSAAMDVTRTAIRLGKKVYTIALETKDIMPAQKEELEEALEEGMYLYDGAMVESVTASKEKGIRLNCIKVLLDQNVPPGVIKPIPQPGTNFSIEADNVIPSIGQDADLSVLEGIVETNGSLIKVDQNLATSEEKFFAGGDLARQDRFVSAAIGDGKLAARSIASAFGDLKVESKKAEEEVAFKDINTFYFPIASRIEEPILDVSERIQNFKEVRVRPSETEILSEAERCFSCGNCIECDNCFYFCPDMAVKRDPSREEKYYVLEQYCKGCGLCVEECPRGAVTLKEEEK